MTSERTNEVGGAVSSQSAPKVLVVDDDRAMRALIEFHFRQAPWETVVAESAAQGLEAFAPGGFALVLLDLELAGVDGRDVARQMRQAEGIGRHAVIWAMSAHARDEGLELPEDFDGALTKPFTKDELLRRVGEVVAPVACAPSRPKDPALAPLMPKFWASVAEQVALAGSALEQQDFAGLAQAAHKIVGSASCFGIEALAEAAEEMEEAALQRSIDGAEKALNAVARCLGDGA